MCLRKSIVFFLIVFASCLFVYSQIVQTGTLNGTVKDKEGNSLPGVTVTIKSPALMAPQISMVTNERGFFRFPALSPGFYAVTYELSGFRTVVREGIRVSVGETVTLDEILLVTPIMETVVVTGKAPVIDITATTITTTYEEGFLEKIPTVRDRIANYFALIPGVSEGTYHGTTSGDQAFMLDGMNISDPLGGSIIASWGFDIMEELSANTGSIGAEFGSVRGAVINAVTKSGGNTYQGQVSFYGRNENLQSGNTKGTPLEGRYQGFRFENDISFGLGGPIIKDKLWFFTNSNYYWWEEYIDGYPHDSPSNLPYDYKRSYIPYIKLSWQATPSNKLVFSYAYKNWMANHYDASRFQTEDTTRKYRNANNSFNLQWTKFFGPNLFIDVKGGYVTHKSRFYAKHTLPRIYDSVTRLYNQNAQYFNDTGRPKVQFVFNLTHFVDDVLGYHEFKTGFEVSRGWVLDERKYFQDPITGLFGEIVTRNGVPDYFQNYDDFDQTNIVQGFGGFLQDTWRPTGRLSLNIGIRYDHSEGVIPRQGEDREPITYLGKVYDPRVLEEFKPMIWNTISPRFGLVYSLTADGKTAIKSSWCRYPLTLRTQWFSSVLNRNSSISWRVRLNPDGTARGDPYLLSTASLGELDPNLKVPYLDEFTFGIEREIIADTRLSLRYINKRDKNILENVDKNALDMDALGRGELVWTNYSPFMATDPFDGSIVTFYGVTDTSIPSAMYITNPPGATRDYDALEVTITKRYSHGWQFFGSYVWAYARGNSAVSSGYSGLYRNPNAMIYAFGRQTNIHPHQIKLQGSIDGPWGINISGYFTYLSGLPTTRTIRSNDLGLPLSQGNVTINAEEKGFSQYPAQTELDFRLEKVFGLGRFGSLALILDAFNAFNANTTVSWEDISSSPQIVYHNTVEILAPRMLRFGVKLEF